jgi:threonine/homoserine/homoserine lactone efflux protein
VIGLAALAGFVIQGIGYGFTAAAQPGAFQTFVISQTLTNGWRRTLPAALAPLVSDAPVVVLMVVVLTRLPDGARSLLHTASGLFILYLAVGALRTWRQFDYGAVAVTAPGKQSLLKAATINLVSPGPYVFWGLIAGPLLMRAWSQDPARGLAFLAGFYVAMIATLGCLVLLFGTARQAGPRVNRALLGVSAIALTAFGVYQLWLGFSTWQLSG